MTSIAPAGRLFAGRTPAERQAERRQQLVSAAAQLYDERGFRNVTVKALCEAAGLTERYFYESFANSEDLLCACFQKGAETLLDEVRAATRSCPGPPLEQARTGLVVYLRILRAQPGVARLFLLEMPSVSSRTDRLVSENLDRFGALLVEILRKSSRPPVAPLLVRGVIGGGLHVAQAWISDGYAEPIDHVAGLMLRLYALLAEG